MRWSEGASGLKIDVLEVGQMGKCKDFKELDKGQIVMTR